MQQPMDSCVCGINTSSESILIRSMYFSRDKHVPDNSGTPILREM